MQYVLQVDGSPQGNPRTNEFRYLWAKHVLGFNPTHHCAACLKGPYEKTIRRGLTDGVYEIEPLAPALYICGVSLKGWANNLHFVVEPCANSEAIADTYNGIRLSIRNARRLPITALPDGWKGLPKAFTTCRNFQFAVGTFGYELGDRQMPLR